MIALRSVELIAFALVQNELRDQSWSLNCQAVPWCAALVTPFPLAAWLFSIIHHAGTCVENPVRTSSRDALLSLFAMEEGAPFYDREWTAIASVTYYQH
ncbi:MAG: hypothetical protein ACPIA2_07470 [Mariniblastus sp.]